MHSKGVSGSYDSLCQFSVLLFVVVHKEACFFLPFYCIEVFFSACDVQAKRFDKITAFENFKNRRLNKKQHTVLLFILLKLKVLLL